MIQRNPLKESKLRANRHADGFTLLELLVVLVVVGVVMGGATIAINQGGREKELNDIVEKFSAYAEHASEMAVITGKPLGLLLEPPAWGENPLEQGWNYRWQTMGIEGWTDYPDLPGVEIPKEFNLYVTIEGELWEWEEAPEIRLPAIAFYPGGDLTFFEIEFTFEDFDSEFSEHVTVDDWGRVVWTEKAEMLEEIKQELGD